MTTSTHLYGQLFDQLRQHSRVCDLRHLKALAWMVSALLYSGELNLAAWEPYVVSRATKAQSTERRWQRFMDNFRISVMAIYVPLVLAALSGWKQQRLYLALDTTVLWDRFCMIHLSVVCCGRAVPLLWRVLEHSSATVAFEEYQPVLRRARWLLRHHPDVMLLADRGFANQQLVKWLRQSHWHYALRLPCDVLIHTTRRYPWMVGVLYPPLGEARLYENVGLWLDGEHRCNLVVATVQGAKESWAVVTDEPPTLQTLWQYAFRFRVEELFLDSKSGAFELEDSRLRSAATLERLYLVAAIALLFATTQGMAVQLAGLRQQVDPHWRRGISYLKIGLRWLQGVIYKGRTLLPCVPLLPNDPEACFASLKAKHDYDDHIWFHRVRSVVCKPVSILN
ncbi:transposase [Oculatella sp. LEGE 06141]|uniref:transposase n=1 Tax=Oculatella sp. LEGE 06141 TaxID=1828648 RepID=UPI00187FA934|nr:transposase [Oculatella sp. LEGE 06141]MBE9182042.1 transposase [Oculatella sp. LEGE 06141]